jgi:hypothetical protein
MNRFLATGLLAACFAMMACGEWTFNYYDDVDVDIVADGECVNADGAYCSTKGIRFGACMNDVCGSCLEFYCSGVAGCSADPAFSNNGDPVDECPDGCFIACAP